MCKHSTGIKRETNQRQLRNKIISIPEHEEILEQVNKIIDGIRTRTSYTSKITDKILRKEYLRSEVVMLVSAFDYYMLEILKLGIIQMFDGLRTRTEKFDKIKVSMENVIEATKNKENED